MLIYILQCTSFFSACHSLGSNDSCKGWALLLWPRAVFALGHLRTFQAKLKSTTLMWLERISISQSIRFRICEFPTDLCLKELSNIGVLLKWATTDPACYSDYCVPLCLVVSCSHTCISFSCRKPWCQLFTVNFAIYPRLKDCFQVHQQSFNQHSCCTVCCSEMMPGAATPLTLSTFLRAVNTGIQVIYFCIIHIVFQHIAFHFHDAFDV